MKGTVGWDPLAIPVLYMSIYILGFIFVFVVTLCFSLLIFISLFIY